MIDFDLAIAKRKTQSQEELYKFLRCDKAGSHRGIERLDQEVRFLNLWKTISFNRSYLAAFSLIPALIFFIIKE